jgi:hypothetical protein
MGWEGHTTIGIPIILAISSSNHPNSSSAIPKQIHGCFNYTVSKIALELNKYSSSNIFLYNCHRSCERHACVLIPSIYKQKHFMYNYESSYRPFSRVNFTKTIMAFSSVHFLAYFLLKFINNV